MIALKKPSTLTLIFSLKSNYKNKQSKKNPHNYSVLTHLFDILIGSNWKQLFTLAAYIHDSRGTMYFVLKRVSVLHCLKLSKLEKIC